MSTDTAPAIRPAATCIDEQLATLHSAIGRLARERADLHRSIYHAAGAREHRGVWSIAGRPGWLSFADVRAIVEEVLAAGGIVRGYYAKDLARFLDRIDAIGAEVDALRAECATLEAVHAAEGWSRFFTVPDGHIHSSTSCHTLRPTTVIGWHPELSGLLEADAVAAFGPTLCTVCYPSAPTEWTAGLPPTVKPGQCEGALVPVVRRAHHPPHLVPVPRRVRPVRRVRRRGQGQGRRPPLRPQARTMTATGLLALFEAPAPAHVPGQLEAFPETREGRAGQQLLALGEFLEKTPQARGVSRR